MMTLIKSAIPVLEVADVAASIDWYGDMLGMNASPFPETPPYSFAILTRGHSEIMLQCGPPSAPRQPLPYRWNVYLRLSGQRLRDLYEQLTTKGVVTRRLERMFYGLAEFEIADPDGYVLCLSEALDEMDDLPTPEE